MSKQYTKSHGDITGFSINSKSPKAPLAELDMYITAEGLKGLLAKMEKNGHTEVNLKYVMFSKSGTTKGKKWTIFNLFPSNKQQDKAALPSY